MNKGLKNILKKKIVNKKVIKKEPGATLVLKKEPEGRTAFFHEQMEQEQRNILKWN